MQQSFRPAEFRQRPRARVVFAEQLAQPLQQAIPHRGKFRREFNCRRFHCFEAVNGVAHVREVEIDSQVAAMAPTLRQQWMVREPRVDLRDQFHGQSHALAVE
ncbi:MAG: hypothetical protein DME25_17245, partial [Verrucomicrobia bacterium]